MSEPATGWQRRLRDDLWGALVIARRELWANILSPRSLVMVLLLSLIMVLAATGFSRFAASQDQGVGEAYVTHVVAADNDTILNDLVVYAYRDDTFGPIMGRNVSLGPEALLNPALKGRTDARGICILKNLTAAYHILVVDLKKDDGGLTTGMGIEYGDGALADQVFIPGVPRLYESPSLAVQTGDFDRKGRLDDLMVDVVDDSGSPIQGVRVNVSGVTNLTDPNGVATIHNLKRGWAEVSVTTDDYPNVTTVASIDISAQQTMAGLFGFAESGPDAVLSLVAQIAIGLLGPIYVIALCFDTISREKLSGSIDYLLCRPMGRRAVIGGKFLGVLGALMVPITAVSMVGVTIIAWVTHRSPSPGAVLGFLVYTVLLIGIFALLQMIFSTLSKTTGTAVLSGIGLWLFFFLLFSIVVAVVGTAMHLTSAEYTLFSTRAGFLNPISLYGLSMDAAISGSVPAGFPTWSPGIAMVVWLVACLAVAMEVFRRRATE